ncbi:MAG: HEAT repeat domain-containing protein [Gemmatimonadetes bacterium]|nr:HEAT repeat domain-containing protein [Gemmatimonadota bacterium]
MYKRLSAFSRFAFLGSLLFSMGSSGELPTRTDLPPHIDKELVRSYLIESGGISSFGGVVFGVFDVMGWEWEEETTIVYMRSRLQEYYLLEEHYLPQGRLMEGSGSGLQLALIVQQREGRLPLVYHRIPEEGEGAFERDIDAIFPEDIRTRVYSHSREWTEWAKEELERQAKAYYFPDRVDSSGSMAQARLYERRYIADLIAALKHEQSDIRVQAARELRQRGSEAPELLIAAVGDEEPFVRATAAEVLGIAKEPRSLEVLIAGLQDKDPFVFGRCALALGQIGDSRAVEPLIAALNQDWRGDRNRGAVILQALGQIEDARATETLIAVLMDENPFNNRRLRNEAAKILVKKKDPRVVEPLIAVLREGGTSWLYVEVADALGASGDRRAVLPLIDALQISRKQELRAHAARALGVLKDERAIDPLIAALQDSVPNVRSAAAGALRELRAERAVPVLRTALDDRYPSVRNSAVDALLKLGDTGAIEVLSKVVNEDPRSDVRKDAARSVYPLYIARGERGSESFLISILQKYGSNQMAADFLHSGNAELVQAVLVWIKGEEEARLWVKENKASLPPGFKGNIDEPVTTESIGQGRLKWGSANDPE